MKPKLMGDKQWNYVKLTREHGEVGARKIVANRLRELADIVESDDYPHVYCLLDEGPEGKVLPVITFELILSWPWPG